MEPTLSASGRETILVVDGDAMARNLATITLSRHGYKVYEAATGAEALRLLQHSPELPLKLLLVETVMPEMNELVERIRAIRPNLLVLYISNPADRDHLRGAVSYSCIEKPWNPFQLTRRVRDLLDRSAAESAEME